MVDVVELDRPVYDQYDVPELFPEVRRAQPVRYVLDLEAGSVVGRETLPFRSMCDFPAIDTRRGGRESDDFWVLGISASERPGASSSTSWSTSDGAAERRRSGRRRRATTSAASRSSSPTRRTIGAAR